MHRPTDLPAWQALQQQRQRLDGWSIADALASDPDRFARYSREVDGLLYDFSRQRLDDRALGLLLDLAVQAGVPQAIAALLAGEPLNHTEGRAALHVALRHPGGRVFCVDGQDVLPAVLAERERWLSCAERIRSGAWLGHTGQPIRTVVNIGIGGSDLGPKMVCEALAPYNESGVRLRFLSTLDPAHVAPLLAESDPETTLFIVASKTFGTQETLTNAHTARAWLVERLGEAAVARHFVAVSTNRAAATAFGIDPEHMFGFWDWVGGRFSLWSAIGLPVAIAIGRARFAELLAGAHAMDQHFEQAALADNLPVLLALIGIWNANFWGTPSQAVLPYDDALRSLPAYLQQLDMESLGKSVDRNGQPVDWSTGTVLWGGHGNNGQHAFYQLLHQGTSAVDVQFLLPLAPVQPVGRHHALLLANALAQSDALVQGRDAGQVQAEMRARGMDEASIARLLPYRVFAGNRPNAVLVYPRTDPWQLGRLIALYEHRVFVQSVIWAINPFDQWGVELGKQMAGPLLDVLEGRSDNGSALCRYVASRLPSAIR